MIIKPLDGMGGASIFRIGRADPNRNVIVETVSHHGAQTVMVQRFIPEIADGDKRVLVIAGEVGARSRSRASRSRARRAATWRPAGAAKRGRSRRASARSRAALGPKLWAEGLLIVGLDVIGPCLTEVNVTSPDLLRGDRPAVRLRHRRNVRRRAGAGLPIAPFGRSRSAARAPVEDGPRATILQGFARASRARHRMAS